MRTIGPGLREALRPLVRSLEAVPYADRRAWLDELRGSAPALAEALEQLEAETRDDGSAGTSLR